MLGNDVALLSIKPNFAEAILGGVKKFEFRRGRIKRDIDFILIYASSPQKALVGFAKVEKIISDTPLKLWKLTGKQGGISHQEFMDYFKGKNSGHAIQIKEIHRFDPIKPKDIIDDFRPPQSFMYVDDLFLNKIYENVAA